jgi:hypothetical protein
MARKERWLMKNLFTEINLLVRGGDRRYIQLLLLVLTLILLVIGAGAPGGGGDGIPNVGG